MCTKYGSVVWVIAAVPCPMSKALPSDYFMFPETLILRRVGMEVETGFLCVTSLTVLELVLETRLALNSVPIVL